MTWFLLQESGEYKIFDDFITPLTVIDLILTGKSVKGNYNLFFGRMLKLTKWQPRNGRYHYFIIIKSLGINPIAIYGTFNFIGILLFLIILF